MPSYTWRKSRKDLLVSVIMSCSSAGFMDSKVSVILIKYVEKNCFIWFLITTLLHIFKWYFVCKLFQASCGTALWIYNSSFIFVSLSRWDSFFLMSLKLFLYDYGYMLMVAVILPKALIIRYFPTMIGNENILFPSLATWVCSGSLTVLPKQN